MRLLRDHCARLEPIVPILTIAVVIPVTQHEHKVRGR
jgi:hypothetical protein